MVISEKTQLLLRKAGWQPDRKIDITDYISVLENEGYTLFPAAIEFLTEFGGLKVTHPHHMVKKSDDFFQTNASVAAEDIWRERVETYEERIGESLVVIGQAYKTHMTMMISPTGRVFAAYDDLLILLGNSPAEALEILCEGKETKEID
ncbi:SUKH-3 domain-containing protein [Brevibacillus dissolubilis]|uniref:SUKH-3 domain-containing protein n=1 Tax=Brevibacillus dissolubilis TaxID=1844116 RepID=UPI00159BDCDA|nr:SUKH-3 domain-containing protein [Brevibacillus dissolubilis]